MWGGIGHGAWSKKPGVRIKNSGGTRKRSEVGDQKSDDSEQRQKTEFRISDFLPFALCSMLYAKSLAP